MITIRSAIWVDAPVERCFRLATSAGFHSIQRETHGDPASVSTAGSLGMGDTLIWPGKTMGINMRYVTRINALRPYCHFREVLESGFFLRLEHDHHFAPMDDGTRIRDEIRFEAPMGALGKVLAPLALKRYLKMELRLREEILKRVAESTTWHTYLEVAPSNDVRKMKSSGEGPVAGYPIALT
jgi:ligand-binding SRPBCC domain-containing protein